MKQAARERHHTRGVKLTAIRHTVAIDSKEHRMQRTTILAALLTFVLPGMAAAQPPAESATAHPAPTAHANAAAGHADAVRIEGCIEATQGFLGDLSKSDYKAATANFDDKLQAALGPDKLATVWQSVAAQFGKLESQGSPQNMMYQGYAVVTVPLTFEKGAIAARLACGADGKFAGFHLVPVASAAPAPSP